MKIINAVLTVALISIISTGCIVPGGFSKPAAANLTEVPISIDAPKSDGISNLEINFPAGRFFLTTGSSKLVEGAGVFSNPRFTPVIETPVTDSYILRIASTMVRDLPVNDASNTWTLKLGNYPLNLAIDVGAYEGSMTFDEYSIDKLAIREGASKSQITFTGMNQVPMSSFEYQTGASQVSLTGLGNLNTANFKFEGGAGSYSFDFSGTTKTDMSATIRVGLGVTKIIVPDNTNVEINVGSGLNNITPRGSWTIEGNHYSRKGFTGPTFRINMETGAGSLDLIAED